MCVFFADGTVYLAPQPTLTSYVFCYQTSPAREPAVLVIIAAFTVPELMESYFFACAEEISAHFVSIVKHRAVFRTCNFFLFIIIMRD